MNVIARAIRELRKEKGWNQSELGAKVGLTQSDISRRESGEVSIPPNEQRKFAKAFGLSIAEFEAKWRASHVPRSVGGRGIPVINRAPAGMVVPFEELSVDSGQGFEYLDWGDVNDDLAFAVVVEGDSMEPSLYEGDYLVFSPMTVPKPKRELRDGAVVFVRFTVESGRDGCALARWHDQGDGVIVLSKDNPGHPPLVCKREDIQQLSVAVDRRTKRGL